MNPILYAIPVFAITILIEMAVAWWRRARIYDLADAITSLQLGVLSQVSGLALKVLALGIYTLVYNRAHLFDWSMRAAPSWILALLFYDFCYYWHHRLSHEVGLLWAAHVVHHSSEYYNLTTALRQTSTGPLFGWIFYLPMAILGVPPIMFVTVGLIDLLYQYWVHTELVGKLGWFDRVIVSPSNHRVHHGQNDYCIDRNYGGILIIWDRLFGSFVEERDGEPICYGIRKPLHSFNPVWGNLHHYADMWRDMAHAQGTRAKLGAWFAPPGGWQTGPLPHFEPQRFARYASRASNRRKGFAVLGYLVITMAAIGLLASEARMTRVGLLLAAGSIVLSTITIGIWLNQPSRSTSL
jgi:sterol desaturase/sphingolipid hydroxylase (fatty acid hydroxylase superfamily)